MELQIIRDNLKKFGELKSLADISISRLGDEELRFVPAKGSLSILAIMHHMAGNMISRWTGFPEEDGEKDFRHRDDEFEEGIYSIQKVKEMWEQGWAELFLSIGNLTDKDLASATQIRAEQMTIHQAILRQLSHLSYHVGQIVFLAKMIKAEEWESLSIPKGQSESFNSTMKAKFREDTEDIE